MPKLTLRDLFAVVTIVALALGWAVDHWRQAESQAALWEENGELRADIFYLRVVDMRWRTSE